MTSTITFHVGDVRDVLATFDDSSVDLLVTSPPFLALRSYLPEDHPDKGREIGAEPTPAAFLDTLLGLTADWRRVVADWGSIAVEIGDTYSGSGGSGGDYDENGLRAGQPKVKSQRKRSQPVSMSAVAAVDAAPPDRLRTRRQLAGWPLAKSLCGIPTLYTWSLAYGRNLLTSNPSPAGEWRIRNLLTWTRPNPPVGALGDKFRPATSFVTVATVAERRWFDLDAVRCPGSANTHARTAKGVDRRATTGKRGDAERGGGWSTLDEVHDTNGAPPLDWWDANDLEEDWQPLHRLPTQPYKGAHYAAFPVALPRRLIDAMCPREVCAMCGEPRRRIVAHERLMLGKVDPDWQKAKNAAFGGGAGPFAQSAHVERTTLGWTDCSCAPMFTPRYRPGIVLDPFGGSGTTAVAAAQAGRDAVLIDLDHRNVDLTRDRIAHTMRIVGEVRTGERVTWTVDATMPGLAGEHPDQLSIFDEAAS